MIGRSRLAADAKDIVARVKMMMDESSAVQTQRRISQTISGGVNPQLNGLRSLLPTWQSITKTIARATALAAAFFGMRAVGRLVSGSVKEFASFDKKLTDSVSLLGKFGLTMKHQIGEIAKTVARDLNLDFDNMAESVGHLISAGFDAAQTMSTLPIIAQFAKAGNMDLRESVDFLADSLHALGLFMEDPKQLMEEMTNLSDTLSKANNLSNATIRDFAEALTNKSAAAMRMHNIELKEGVSLLMAYAAQGKKGREAGTYFDMFLRDVTRAALRNKDAFEKMNIRVFESNGALRPLAEIVDDFTAALDNMAPKQQTAALLQLGMTQRSLHATKVLLGTGDAIREYQNGLDDASGTTKEMVDIRMTSFSERMGRVMQDVKLARMEIGEEFVPALEKAARSLNEGDSSLVSALKEFANFLNDNSEDVGEFVTMLVEIVANLTKLSVILSKPFIWTWKIVVDSPISFMKELGKKMEDQERDAFGGLTFDEFISNKFQMGEVWKGGGFGTTWESNVKPDKGDGDKSGGDIGDDDDLGLGDDDDSVLNKRENVMLALQDQLAKLSGSKGDDWTADLAKLEKRFVDAYGKNIPQAAKEGLSRLRDAAVLMQGLEGRRRELKFFEALVPTPEAKLAMEEYIATLLAERDSMEQGSKLREDYNNLIGEASALYQKLSEDIRETNDEFEEFKLKFEEIYETGFLAFYGLEIEIQALEEIGIDAAYGIMGAFQETFEMIWSDAARTRSVFESLAGGIFGALLGGFAQYAASKVAENIAAGFENIAKAKAAAAMGVFNPAWAVAAGIFADAAKGHFVAAAKWAVLGAGAAAAQSAVAGGSRAGRSGGIPSGASDIGGRLSEDGAKGIEVHVYLDGVDADNPRHQRIIGQTNEKWMRRGAKIIYHNRKK